MIVPVVRVLLVAAVDEAGLRQVQRGQWAHELLGRQAAVAQRHGRRPQRPTALVCRQPGQGLRRGGLL